MWSETLPPEEYEGLIAEIKGSKGLARHHHHLASMDRMDLLAVLHHGEYLYLDAESCALHREFVVQTLAWLTEELLVVPELEVEGLLPLYYVSTIWLLMRITRWAGEDPARRGVLLSVVSTEDLWRVIADMVSAGGLDDVGFDRSGIKHASILFENPPSPGLLRDLASVCDEEGSGYFDALMANFYLDNPEYVESLPVGMLGHRSVLRLHLGNHEDFEACWHPRAIVEMVRLTGGSSTVRVSGTMRFVVEAVIPALRASPWRDGAYRLDVYVDDEFVHDHTPSFIRLMEGAWDLPVKRLLLAVRSYEGPETFRDMVESLSAFDLRSLHEEQIELIGPDVDTDDGYRPDQAAYHNAAAFLKQQGWQEVILSPR
jgi:hypothetical protein